MFLFIRIGFIKVYVCLVIFVGVCIVFVKLFEFIIVWILCVEIRLRKLIFRLFRIMMLEEILLVFLIDYENFC